jgi:hypothetical protein
MMKVRNQPKLRRMGWGVGVGEPRPPTAFSLSRVGMYDYIFDNISSTRLCLALQNNTHVVTDCSSTYNFNCEGSGEWKP